MDVRTSAFVRSGDGAGTFGARRGDLGPVSAGEIVPRRGDRTWRVGAFPRTSHGHHEPHHVSSACLPEQEGRVIERRAGRADVVDEDDRGRHSAADPQPEAIASGTPLVAIEACLSSAQRRAREQPCLRQSLPLRHGPREPRATVEPQQGSARVSGDPGDHRAAREAVRRELREEERGEAVARSTFGGQDRVPH